MKDWAQELARTMQIARSKHQHPPVGNPTDSMSVWLEPIVPHTTIRDMHFTLETRPCHTHARRVDLYFVFVVVRTIQRTTIFPQKYG